MKVYNLICSNQHAFEGWFASALDFESQSNDRSIQCPMCESADIQRLPSAPRLNLSSHGSDGGQGEAAKAAQRALGERLAAFAKHVIANTEDVGEAFAEEARKIHYKEVPERAIRGLATVAEREELADEGIDVMALPLGTLPESPLH